MIESEIYPHLTVTRSAIGININKSTIPKATIYIATMYEEKGGFAFLVPCALLFGDNERVWNVIPFDSNAVWNRPTTVTWINISNINMDRHLQRWRRGRRRSRAACRAGTRGTVPTPRSSAPPALALRRGHAQVTRRGHVESECGHVQVTWGRSAVKWDRSLGHVGSEIGNWSRGVRVWSRVPPSITIPASMGAVPPNTKAKPA